MDIETRYFLSGYVLGIVFSAFVVVLFLLCRWAEKNRGVKRMRKLISDHDESERQYCSTRGFDLELWRKRGRPQIVSFNDVGDKYFYVYKNEDVYHLEKGKQVNKTDALDEWVNKK